MSLKINVLFLGQAICKSINLSSIPGRVRTNICTFIQIPLKTDGNHGVFFIGSVDEDIEIIFQEDKKPINEWEWLMNAEPDKDTQVVWFNGKETVFGMVLFF